MKNNLKNQLDKIAATPHVPDIFRVILQTQDLFADGEEIVDAVFVERDGCEVIGSTIRKFESWQAATLLIVTNYGITVLREGGVQIADSFYGYQVRHIVFNKISSIALDICVLAGTLAFATSTGTDPDTVISFNTSRYFKEFERIVGAIRNLMFNAAKA